MSDWEVEGGEVGNREVGSGEAQRAEPLVVELLYFEGCPNHDSFLPHLEQLLAGLGVDSPVRLVEVGSDEDAQRLRFLGSPSLRINGHDVEPGADTRQGYGLQCRLYNTPQGLTGTPLDDWVRTSLHP